MKKGTLVALVFLGVVSAIIAVLGPIHEIWHYLVSLLYGTPGQMEWGGFYIDTDALNLPIIFAGMFGETLTLTALFFLFFKKGWFDLSAYIMGYMGSFVIILLLQFTGFYPIDVQVAYTIAPHYVVTGVYLVWQIMYICLLFVQILTFVVQKRIIFNNYNKKETIYLTK